MSVCPTLVSVTALAGAGNNGGSAPDVRSTTVTAKENDLIVFCCFRARLAAIGTIQNTSRSNVGFTTQSSDLLANPGSILVGQYVQPADGTDTWQYTGSSGTSINATFVMMMAVVRGADLANPYAVGVTFGNVSSLTDPWSISGITPAASEPECLGFTFAASNQRTISTLGFDATGGWANQLNWDVDVVSTPNTTQESTASIATKFLLPNTASGSSNCDHSTTAIGRTATFAIRGARQDLAGFF